MAQKLSLYAGQGVGKIHSVVPAAERVAELALGLVTAPDQPPNKQRRALGV
jgi:enoyl-[acyl-carrier protein] reductase II